MPPNLNTQRPAEGLPAKLSIELDLFPGLSCILDSRGIVRAVSHSWDQYFARADRNEFRSAKIVGAVFADLLTEESLKTSAAVSLEELRTGIRDVWTQPVDFSGSGRPLVISFSVRWCQDDRGRGGFLVHGWDVTQDYLTRAAVLDRERKLQELRATLSAREAELEEIRAMLDGREQEIEALKTASNESEQEAAKLRAALAEAQREAETLRDLLDEDRRGAAQRPVSKEPPTSAHRQLTANLAEEFANLLTGVLGHSSLAVAELSESHSAVENIREIERTAREAARVTRKLGALCGTARRGSGGVDLKSTLEQWVSGRNAKQNSAWTISCESVPGTWTVGGDHSSFEIMLEAMSDHVWRHGGMESHWTLEKKDGAILTGVEWNGETGIPEGWREVEWSAHTRMHPEELLFAREVARALGGELELTTYDSLSRMELRLPEKATERVPT